MILRQSFINTFIRCPRLAKRELEDKRPVPAYMLGGQVVAQLCNLWHRGLLTNESGVEMAARVAVALRMSGEYLANDEDIRMIADRGGEAFNGYRHWFKTMDWQIVASELEFRSIIAGNEVGGTIDLIVVDENGDYIIPDIKTHGLWGKGVAVQKLDPIDMRRKLQLAVYSTAMANGTKLFANGSIGRDETAAEAEQRGVKPVRLSIDAKKMGFIEVANLYPYLTGDKKGQPRGNPLMLVDFDFARRDYAEEVISYVGNNVWLGSFPRFESYYMGQSSCEKCSYDSACHPAGAQLVVPSFLRGK